MTGDDSAGMRGLPVAELLALPVRMHGIGLGRPIDVLLDEQGERVVGLQLGLADRVRELETALGQVKQLKGLLPICGYCKKVRDDRNYWQRVETYISAHSDARFSHGICPDCWKNVVEPELTAGGFRPQPPDCDHTHSG